MWNVYSSIVECAISGAKRHCLCNIWNLPRRGGRKELLELEVEVVVCKYRRQGQGGGGTIHCNFTDLIISRNIAESTPTSSGHPVNIYNT